MSEPALAAAALPPPGSVRAVLFDLDGTLVDSAPDMAAALNRLRSRHALPALPIEAVRPHVSRGARGMLLAGFGLTPEDARFAPLREEFLEDYARNLCIDTCLFPGAQEVMQALEAKNIHWGIVTNKATHLARPLLAALGVEVSCVVCGDTTPHTKPHPEPLLHALRHLEVPAATTLYVGDDHRDALAAQAANMPFVTAAYGYLGIEAHPDTWPAAARIHAPTAILDLV